MEKIGYFDPDIMTPEEVLMAAGFTPVRLLGDSSVEYERVNEHVPPTHCVWARNVLEQALRGLNPEIKGIITSHGCDCTNREFDLWLENVDLDFMFFLNVPLKRNDIAQKFFVKDIKEMIRQLEEQFSVDVKKENISEAIKLMNQIREILKEISELRNKMLIRGSEFHDLVKMAQVTEKEQVLKHLKEKVAEFKQRDPFESSSLKKVLLTGSVIDDTEFLRNLEDLGFQIVIDDLCIGTRYCWDLVDEDKDPLKALAEYHLSKPIYSTKFPSFNRFGSLKQLAEDYEVEGVINVAMKFCEPLLYSHPHFSKRFKELDIPYLFIETEYNRESFKQLSTRFEAFGEII